MSKKQLTALVVVLAVLLVAGAAVYSATAYGTESDPLVAKSYLDEVLRPELEAELQTSLDAAAGEMRAANGEFTLLSLNNGQSVTCAVGCEILLRLGSARASGASEPALVDTTAGATVSNGTALSANHLYLVSIAGNGFTAAQNGTAVLISGSYTVN